MLYPNGALLKTGLLTLVFGTGAVVPTVVQKLQVVPAPSWSDLQTVSGVAALTAVILGLFVKPWLRPKVSEEYYQAVMNIAALVVALSLSFAAAAVLPMMYENILNAAMVGLLGAAAAIGGFEVVKARR